MAERFALYGMIPTERDANIKAMTLAEQQVGDTGDTLIYETDDRDEARAIYEAGGFERNGVWHAVTRVKDRQKQTGAASQAHSQPDKRDYDQA